jgi:hypothetical protein
MSSAIPGRLVRSLPLRAAGRTLCAQCGDGLEEAVDLVRERPIELGHGCCNQ